MTRRDRGRADEVIASLAIRDRRKAIPGRVYGLLRELAALRAGSRASEAGRSAVETMTSRQIESLVQGGLTVEIVIPDAEFLELSGGGRLLLDTSGEGRAFELGLNQGRVEAMRLQHFAQ